MVLRYFDLQARNYVPVLIPLSSPPHPHLLSRVIWNHSTKHHFFSFFGGVGVELCSMQDASSPDQGVTALCSGSLEDSPPGPHQQSPCLSPRHLRFAPLQGICTQSHSYHDDELAIQTFLINYHCLLLLEHFSF